MQWLCLQNDNTLRSHSEIGGVSVASNARINPRLIGVPTGDDFIMRFDLLSLVVHSRDVTLEREEGEKKGSDVREDVYYHARGIFERVYKRAG